MLPQTPIIDSHVHLYAADHLSRLNWTSSLPDDHILKNQRSVQDYRVDIRKCPNVVGFVFVETDCKFSLDPLGWQDPLQEVDFLARIARGQIMASEGVLAGDGSLVLGIVPWAPVPAGPAALNEYFDQVRRTCVDSETLSLVKGVRYLLQDKSSGTMLAKEFIDGLQWLGQHNLTFDLGIDARSGGLWQLKEACAMLREVYRGGSNLKVIINHFCKPNLHLNPSELDTTPADLSQWAEYIQVLASFPGTFMKMSGFFSELPMQDESAPTPVNELANKVAPWVDVVFKAFTPARIMFGSDWPVCTANGPGSDAWQHWHDVVAYLLDERGCSPDEQRQIWSETAMKAYSIIL